MNQEIIKISKQLRVFKSISILAVIISVALGFYVIRADVQDSRLLVTEGIIIKDNINEPLINELKHIWERDGIFIIIENIKCLQFNILNHTLDSKHLVKKENEVNDIMVRYNITDKTNFPPI